jgi:hypothetical protein
MERTTRVAWIVGLSALLVLTGSALYVRWSLRHMRLDLDLRGLSSGLGLVELLTGGHSPCIAGADPTSLGDREQEAEMSYVATMPDLYKSRFGVLPSGMTDLNRLPEFDTANRLNNREFENNCSIYFDQSASFAVSCGSSKPPSRDMAAFLRNAPFMRRFYLVGNKEVLYVPAPKC